MILSCEQILISKKKRRKNRNALKIIVLKPEFGQDDRAATTATVAGKHQNSETETRSGLGRNEEAAGTQRERW